MINYLYICKPFYYNNIVHENDRLKFVLLFKVRKGSITSGEFTPYSLANQVARNGACIPFSTR